MSPDQLQISIESQKFPRSYLRIDGDGASSWGDQGGGTVNAQNYVGSSERFIIVNDPDDNNAFSIYSSQFKNVYLRLDGRGVTPGQGYPSGAGKVNCQNGSESWEKFRFESQPDGSKAIASVAFPGVYLRLDNSTGGGGSSGSGTVNCQGYVGPYEKFFIILI
ncbi:uncharacterized protein N7446_005115 [Penicillium canescens]|uniref:Uncharacterized protein n=1 Tax=Penicillium canescens TaxID=5083 RepID=A0AAD6IA89_PENCN|nr:uncharacterized protein N7446_005115 [Penicillium canescens]KAJ6038305.1 hypothetical protein N7460_008076 [Penicillium canescens]KAJ6039577.1 hypothetical protein N7444_008482 [Penicillium canescens]KAJ6068078.1 hypothetical protein N7446_005115 [Penicillium canescens]